MTGKHQSILGDEIVENSTARKPAQSPLQLYSERFNFGIFALSDLVHVVF
jgi:hypothetical protein